MCKYWDNKIFINKFAYIIFRYMESTFLISKRKMLFCFFVNQTHFDTQCPNLLQLHQKMHCKTCIQEW
jgi:hypothetical protein